MDSLILAVLVIGYIILNVILKYRRNKNE